MSYNEEGNSYNVNSSIEDCFEKNLSRIEDSGQFGSLCSTYFYVEDVFVFIFGQSMRIFKKKSSQRFWDKVPNFGYYIKK